MANPTAPLLRRRMILGGTQETDRGTFVAPTVALASTAVYDAAMNLERVYDDGIRKPLGNYLGTVMAAPGITAGRLTFRNEIAVGDKTLPLLTGAGFLNTAGTYTPTSLAANWKTWSFKLWQDGRAKEMFGAAADATIMLEVGKPASITWDWLGAWRVLPTDAALPAQAPLAALPYVCTAMTMTIGGTTLRMSKAEIKFGNTVTPLTSLAATTGLVHSVVADRQMTIAVDTEATTKAILDTYGLTTTATEVAISAVLTIGANTLTINAPKAQRVAVTEGERDESLLDEVVFNLNASSGDDEISLVEA